MRFKGKVCLVTGSSRGIGLAVAKEFAREGAVTLLNSHTNAQEAEVAVREIESEGGRSLWFKADVSQWDQVEEMFQKIEDQFGGVDVLVNNAGINRDRTLLKMSPQEWREVVDVNLTGPFYCTKLAVRKMVERGGGRIINIASVIGKRGNFGQSNYAAAKAGLIGFTKSVAMELASKKILVNAIAPGFIHTRMTEELMPHIRENVTEKILLKRFGSPRDIAKLALFLASEEASYITGEVFGVDGGYTG